MMKYGPCPTDHVFGHVEGDKIYLKINDKMHDDGILVDMMVTLVWNTKCE